MLGGDETNPLHQEQVLFRISFRPIAIQQIPVNILAHEVRIVAVKKIWRRNSFQIFVQAQSDPVERRFGDKTVGEQLHPSLVDEQVPDYYQ